ncbi:hypothetical protein [Acinetobacter venetianus]|uniref:hypothetical protein n=1 Tax=Acinetobacter venetianus TaxID=52133 RepID=UPI00214F92B3|nr:hypothetical protein [Acinetobacter venetianus]MCR4532769.1 hypothetical protein [Acinetobacter venetianus]
MNKLNLKIVSLLIVIVYSIVVLYWVTSDERFYGIRFLSIWSVVLMWLLIALFIDTGKKIKNKTIEEIEKYKKSRKYYVGLFLILMPTAMELPDKLAILFYSIEESYKKAEVYNVKVKGYFKTGTSKRGGDIWASAKDIIDERQSYVMVCNLISKVKCSLGDLKEERAIVKLSQEKSYPLGHMSVVYGFKSKSVTINDNKLIELYKENKRFVFYFLFFIYIPSICFSLVVPKFFK